MMASTSDELAKFSNESLHSFSFTAGVHDKSFVEGRRGIFYRSIDFMKQKIKGWQVPISNVFPVSASTTPTDSFSIGAYPSHAASPMSSVGAPSPDSVKAKLKRTMTDIRIPSSSSNGGEPPRERSARPLSVATVSAVANYSSLHSPTRFVPQSQAMITTDENWKIVMANDIASLVFGFHGFELVSMNMLDLIASPYKEKLDSMLRSHGPADQHGSENQDISKQQEHVLLCGKIIRIQKHNSHSAAASIWLKRRTDTTGKTVYIWVVEEIAESVVTAVISSSGEILNIEGAIQELYGYDFLELLGRSITTLIPGLETIQSVDPETSFATLDVHQINVIKFFGSRSKNGSTFPIICRVLNPSDNIDPEANPFQFDSDQMDGYLLRIISMPAIAGVVTLHASGMIQSANTVFTKYLFGYPAKELIEKKAMSDLIPQFAPILEKLLEPRDDALPTDHLHLTDGAVVTATIIRRTAAEVRKPSVLSPDFFVKPKPEEVSGTQASSTNKQTSAFKRNFGMSSLMKKDNPGFISNSGIVGLHRDGTPLDIDVQIRMIESPQGPMFAVWITYDREISFAREPNRKPPTVPVIEHTPATVSSSTSPSPRPSTRTPSFQAIVNGPSGLARPSSPASFSSTSSSSPTSSSISATSTSSSASRSCSSLSSSSVADASGALQDMEISNGADQVVPDTDKGRSGRNLSNESVQSSGSSSYGSPMSPAPSSNSTVSLSSDEMKLQYSAVTHRRCINDFEILDSLGQGAYGQVKLCQLKGSENKVVMKYIVKSRILVDCWMNDKILGMIPMEIHIMHTLRKIPHPNIVSMLDFFEDSQYYYVEMALHGTGMDLFDYIELTPYMTENEIRAIFRQICNAVHHLHSNKIVHRDIKDENVILDQEGNIQLIDFGSSAYLREGKKFDTFCGTLDYAAPEVLTGKKYEGRKQDIWALGILLYTLIYKENPFYNIDEILSRDLRVPFVLSEDSIALIRWMLNRDIDQRPWIEEVLNHPWMTAPDHAMKE
ncbi:hypothetical protein DFQ27_008750 [Actinomortierella ambigua]|uniref:non-specific serine/threonine protein kinase n=1 Tax=Actinomortierella ambigua TaxID=1343610 RepID=A0A9P6QHS9_9FUNG|nr:hypothetical protein DFQ27_008750 [Actinomortierella ambigua]